MKPDTTIKKESNSYSIDQEKINRLILANSNSRVDLINTKKFRDYNYNTNLHRSVLKNNIKFVEYFLKKGLDVNKKNKNGDTALHFAFKIKNYDIIQLLLEYGASIKIKNNKGITPFEVANKDIKDTFNLVEIYNNPDEY
jgi:ankyrin repeat protein